MAEQNNAFYPIQTIRKIGNIPLELLGLTMSEITLLIQITGLSYVFGIIIQIATNFLVEGEPSVMYYALLLVPMMAFVMRYINNNYGKGLIFFIVASFKAKDFPAMNDKPILRTKEL